MKQKLLSILALLCLTVSSAWAQWTGGTYTATANETINSTINVSADATLTINAGVTVTVNRSITVTSGNTLTIVGPGTLTVYGTDGANGTDGSDGKDGVAAITGNIIVKGATVNATGGVAGNGGDSSTGNGGKGAVGARGLSNGTVTIYYGTINATGGKGGNGGNSTVGQGGDGGQGGYAKAEQHSENLYYYGGTVNFTSGAVGKGGTGSAGNGSDANRRKAFAHNILTLQNTQVTLTGDGANITPITTNPTVNIYNTVNIVPNVVASGDCGTTGHESDVTWTLTSDGVMTISGTGAMANFDPALSDGNKAVITSIVIGEGVTTIADHAFEECENVESVSIPASVTSIGGSAFSQAGTSATTMTVTIAAGSNLATIGGDAFSFCSSLETITIPSSVTTIGMRAFVMSGLTSVTLADGLKVIDGSAFKMCPMTTITIPASVTSIGESAFFKCSNLATITLNSNPFIRENAFADIAAGAAVTMNLTANAAGDAKWATFYNKLYSFEADENTQVFKAELSGSTITLHEVDNKIVDAGTAVVLKSSGNPVMTLTTEASSNTDSNSLEGVSNAEGTTSDGTMYVLNYKAATGVGLYKLTSGKKLGVGKAYLTYSGSGAPGFFGFGDDATSIKSLTPDPSPNGEGSEYYDLQGRRVAQPTKGLYIVNGKKVVIK